MGRALIILLLSYQGFSETINIDNFYNSNQVGIKLNYFIKPYGLRRTGQSCKSDYSCASLCCKHGRCASHNPSMGAYCAKGIGQSCVSRSYCGKQIVESCFIVRTGKKTCALRCYRKREFARCRNGRCTKILSPPVPSFNPKNPDCSEAIEPPY